MPNPYLNMLLQGVRQANMGGPLTPEGPQGPPQGPPGPQQAQAPPQAPPKPQDTISGFTGFLGRLFGGDDPNVDPAANAAAQRRAIQQAGLGLMASVGTDENLLSAIGKTALGTRGGADQYRQELAQKAMMRKLFSGGIDEAKLERLYQYAVQTGDDKLANSAVAMLNAYNNSKPKQGTPHFDEGINPATGKPEQYRVTGDGKIQWMGVAPIPGASGSNNLARQQLVVTPEDARKFPSLAGSVGKTFVFSIDPKTNAKLGPVGPVPESSQSTRFSVPKLYRDPTFQNPDGTYGANIQVAFDRETGRLVNAATGLPVTTTNMTSPFTARQDQGIQMIRAAGTTLDGAQPLSIAATKFVLNAGEDLNDLTSVAGYTALSDADKETVVSARQFVDGMIDLMNVSRPNVAFQNRLMASISPQAGDTPRVLAQKALLRHTIARGDLNSAFEELQALSPTLAADARHLLAASGRTGNAFVDEGGREDDGEGG